MKSVGLVVSDVGKTRWVMRYVGVSMIGRLELGTEEFAAGAGEEGWVRTGA